MRYLLIAVLLVAVVTACHAEEAKTTKTEYAVSVDTTKINLGQQVDGVADALKKHLDGPLGMYYQAAVHRNIVMGAVGLAALAGFLLVIILSYRQIAKLQSEGEDCTAPVVVCVIMFVIMLFIGPIWYSAIECLSAPQYVAMRDIMQSIGTIVK